MQTFKEFNENKEYEKQINQWNYWLIFENDGDVIHCSGFMEEPQENDIEHIVEELKTDEEFKLTSETLKTMTYSVMNKEDGKKAIERLV